MAVAEISMGKLRKVPSWRAREEKVERRRDSSEGVRHWISDAGVVAAAVAKAGVSELPAGIGVLFPGDSKLLCGCGVLAAFSTPGAR